MNLELLWLHHWLIFELDRNAWIACSHILDIPITSRRPIHHLHCSASAQIISELGRMAWIFCIHILQVDIPIIAHSRGTNHHLHGSPSSQISSLFISLIKSLILAGMLQYLAVTSSTFQLLLIINATLATWGPSPSNAHSPRAMHCRLGLALLVSRPLIIPVWASHLCNSTTASRAKLTRRSWIPQHACASTQSWCHALAVTCKGAAKQQLINLM